MVTKFCIEVLVGHCCFGAEDGLIRRTGFSDPSSHSISVEIDLFDMLLHKGDEVCKPTDLD